MRTVRLLPVIVVAASALLVLKTAGLVTGAGYTLAGMGSATAQEGTAEPAAEPALDRQAEGYDEADIEAAEAAAEALFSEPAGAGVATPTPVTQDDGEGGTVPISSAASATEEIVAARLAERRAELDAFAAELADRLTLVEAAELRIDQRMAELAAIETRINSALDAQAEEEQQRFANLVAMYEAMRPAQAGAIFDSLDIEILARVGEAMNPRRLGPILAAMDPARARQLTIRLANPDAELQATAEPEHAELPQIVGQ
ncbi:MotE family protein [Pelagibacterium montanilacus]|uniref:MotE family protein n=1 Tax=Pelagibacterium montanilacus TaxID=2185280 RepID=UPI000F8CBC14|nr:hypothetical protein [Pelagibacterium montanilacus]